MSVAAKKKPEPSPGPGDWFTAFLWDLGFFVLKLELAKVLLVVLAAGAFYATGGDPAVLATPEVVRLVGAFAFAAALADDLVPNPFRKE